MNKDKLHHHYQLVEKAIGYLQDNFKSQPSLEELAEQVHLSPFHFQRVFTEWAGVSPKKFLQYISVEYAKQSLADRQATLFDVAMETGLSSTGRLHDLFINIEGMSPGEYKNGGRALTISYEVDETIFGRVVIAATEKGICFLHFESDEEQALEDLFQAFPQATFVRQKQEHIQNVLAVFSTQKEKIPSLKLHLKASPFQLKVWEALLKIPMGKLTTYGSLAEEINNPKASRAVGTAVGKNPVAFLIPCHRVIQSGGLIGGYRWGKSRKKAMIGWEASKYKDFWNERLDELENKLNA